ncbi:MAG: ABC transporter ATP-binding protein [Fretibacterium sp.]|nr:ABC transporter ATP-binding protein [Fretibacterium sp.]
MGPILSMSDVVFRFFEQGKRNVLDHVSLEIEGGGRITLLMGGSGCGKSTLAAVAAGLYPENGGFLEGGTIKLGGIPVAELAPSRRAAFLTEMFQNPDLQFCMDTLRGEMRFCMENIGVPPSEMDGRIRRAAEEMGVAPLLDRPLYTLSGGEKQRSTLACLFVMESRCLLLDEPFANIDRAAAARIVRLLHRVRDGGRSIIVVDHQLDLWLDAADEIIILGEGARVLQRGITRENIGQYVRLFDEQGLFFPEAEEAKTASTRRFSHHRGEDGKPAVQFEGLSVPQGTPGRRGFLGGHTPSGEWLLRDADASFPAGRMTAVLGPSGSGKTTTFLAALSQHPYEGTIRVLGTDIRRMRRRELYRRVGIVFQNPANQFITQNVAEEVRESLRVWEKGLMAAECEARAEEQLEAFGLRPYRRFSPYMLSQGQQRRLAVLSVLAGGQRVLFLDEPTYGQDRRSTDSIMEALRRKVSEEGLTVIFITHDRRLVRAWADKAYLLEDKKLMEAAP